MTTPYKLSIFSRSAQTQLLFMSREAAQEFLATLRKTAGTDRYNKQEVRILVGDAIDVVLGFGIDGVTFAIDKQLPMIETAEDYTIALADAEPATTDTN